MELQFVLLFLLMCCHYLADFTALSTSWMLQAKKRGTPLFPILVHASIHASLMAVVLYFFVEGMEIVHLFGFQLIIHFLLDTLKGRLNFWFVELQDSTKRAYWMVLGADQFLHHVTILAMVYYVFH